MIFAEIKLEIRHDGILNERELDGLDIDEALDKFLEALPKLPKNTEWHLIVNE